MRISLNRLVMVSSHPILDQVAQDIMRGVDVTKLPNRDITVFIGAHKRFPGIRKTKGLKICIQTEIFFDDDGSSMWRKPRWTKMLPNIINCDIFLDLNKSNSVVYRWLPNWLRKKIVFGPKIFPSNPNTMVEGNGQAVFFGTMSERRQRILNSSGEITIINNETFGSELSEAMSQASAVFNLHYFKGRYSEFPRLLSAYLAGKPVVSETLSHELEAGRHYLPLDASFDAETLSRTFELFSTEFASQNKFTDFLLEYGDVE